MENSLGSLSDPDSDSIHQMDVHRLDGLWNHLIRSASKLSNFTTSGIDGTVAFIDPLRQILDLFMEVVAAIQDEVVVIKLLWSLDRGIERRLFTPLIVVNAILPRRELTVENRVFFRSVFRFLLKLVFFLDYKNNRFVFSKTIEKSCLFYAPSSKGRSLYAYDLYPAVELIQVLLCREINLLPAYFTMHELNTKFRGDKSTRPHNLIEPEVERFMAEFDFPLRILYSYHELDMVPFAGITLDTHPGFRLDRAQLTLSMIRQAKLYPPAFKTRQLSLACSLLGQLRCTQLASGLLACDERQAMGPLMTPVGLAISELIFSVMEITEAEKRTDWTIKVFGHLADLVICFVVDRIVRLDDIITKLNSKIVGRFWPVSRYFVMWFTLVCMSGFVGKNKLSDFVSCLRLYDHLFPESDELDNAAMGRLKKLEKEDTECWIRRGDLITLDTLETMAKDPDRRFIIFSPDRLFGVPDTDSAEEDQGGSSRDQTSHGTAAIDAVCDYTSSSDSSDDEDLEAGEDGPIPAKKPKLTQDEDLTHLVAAVVCAWEVVLQMNSADETTVRGQSGVGSTGGCVKDGHLPRPMPPLLYPLQLQISDWLEQLKDACGQDNSSLTESGDTAPDSQSSASVERMSWLEFIVTLNTYSPNENSQKITRSVVNAFWLPNNEHVPGIGGGLPLNNGTFTLPYGLSGAGRLKPLSHRLIRKMSVHLQMIFCNEMRQKLNEMTKPPCPEPGTACLTSPATLETFSRFLSYQVEKNLIIPILQIYKRMLQIKGQVDIPLYHDEVAGPEATELPKSMPNNDDFYAFTFWFDLLGHRLVEALPAEHRLSYRDDLFHKVELESQELVYTLDWTIVRFSRRILTPDCILYTMSKSMPNDTSPSPPALKSQHLIHPREVTSRVILLSTLQAVSAFDLLDVGSVRCIIEQQLMTVRTETRAVFGVDTARLLLPSIISRRLTDLLPSSSFGTTSFFGFCANETVLPPDGSSALAQAPIFESLEPAAGDGEPENYASLRDRLLISVYELFKSLVPEAGGEIAWDELSLQGERCFCVIITAILNGHSGLPWALINNILQLSPATVNAQLKVLCEYLIAAICKFEELDRRGLCPPAHLPTPSALLSALLTFCVQYHIITMDRLLLYLFVRSNQSPVDVAAAHSIAIFLFTQCPQLVEAINAVANFAPNSPEIISSHRWPKLLKRLHEILPEKQAINRPPADSSGSSTVLRRYPCQPVYYDHLILRLVPVLELIFTSFLDNPPPLLQLARFCNLVAPLFRLHSHPMSLCFVLLRGQFQHFSTGAVGAAGQGAATPKTPTSQHPHAWRNATRVDKVTCQLIIRCLLWAHQALAVRANANRECAQAFVDTDHKVTGLLSPPAWSTLELLHEAAMKEAGDISTYTDVDSADCIRAAYGADAEIRLASALQSTSEDGFPDLEDHLARIMEPVVKSTEKHGLHGSPSAWRSWRTEENVNPQAAGLYAVAIELMVLHPPSDTSRVLAAASALIECLRKRSGAGNFTNWLNVTGALVSILPFVFRHNILCQICNLIHDPCFGDSDLWPSALVTVKMGDSPSPSTSPEPLRRLLEVFRRRRSLTGQPLPLTVFEDEVEDPNDGTWEVLGRPHASAVLFFEKILPPQFPKGQELPNHNFKAAIWHAIWSHANLNENPTLLRVFDEFVLKYVNNEAKLLMAFSLITPPMKALNTDNSTKVVDLTVSLYKAVQQVDEALAAKNVPMYHVNTIADLLYHIKYTFVGNAVKEKVQGLLGQMRPRLQACLKFVFPTPITTNTSPTLPPGNANDSAPHNPVLFPVFEEREYRAALRPPACLGDDFF